MYHPFFLLSILFLLFSQPAQARNYVLHPQGQADRTA